MNFNLISVLVLVMSGLSLYVGFYHLLTYYSGLRDKTLIYFSATCLSVALYTFFCAGLYNADTVAQGMVWQRYQFATLAILSIFMIWFVFSFTDQKSYKVCHYFTLIFILFFISGFVVRNEMTLSLSNPSPKTIVFGDSIKLVYNECNPGLIYFFQYCVMSIAIAYITYLLIKHYRNDSKKQSRPIIIAMLIFFITAINDIFVGSGLYPFIYIAEYFFLIIILTMSYVLLNRFVSFHVELEDVNKNLEKKVDERTIALMHAKDQIEKAYEGVEKRVEERTVELKREIAERLQAEQEFRQLRNYLKDIIDSMPSIIVGVDSRGKVTQWNDKAEAVTGVSPQNAFGRSFPQLFPQFAGTEEKIAQAIKEHRILTDKKIQTEEMGSDYYWDITYYPLVANGVKGAVIRLDDVTEYEKKENQFRQAQKMETVGTLAGGFAHDFNNVLGGIVGTLSLIKYKIQNADSLGKATIQGYLNTMEKSSQRAMSMFQQLLTLSRKQDISLVSADLNVLAGNVMEICKNTFDKSIKLEPHFQESPAMIHADPAQIEQVILNLCVNASHAMTIMREAQEVWGGNLTLTIDSIFADHHFINTHPEAVEKNYWVVSVKDTGVGMDSKTLAKIFNPFFTTKMQGMGTGLGLSMVYRIIEHHKGFIDVYSEKMIGSTFNIYLPVLEDNAGEKRTAPKESEIPHGEGVILVVDDEEVLRNYAKDVLEECGYEVLLAKNGAEGVARFKEHHNRIKAVFLDMVMPEMSGKDAYLEIKKIAPDVKVLLASGFRQDERVESVLKLGINGFIQKPYTLKNLAKAIHEIIYD